MSYEGRREKDGVWIPLLKDCECTDHGDMPCWIAYDKFLKQQSQKHLPHNPMGFMACEKTRLCEKRYQMEAVRGLMEIREINRRALMTPAERVAT